MELGALTAFPVYPFSASVFTTEPALHKALTYLSHIDRF